MNLSKMHTEIDNMFLKVSWRLAGYSSKLGRSVGVQYDLWRLRDQRVELFSRLKGDQVAGGRARVL